jgi:predicted phosphate transport protein (TIGR00153 family)
VVDAWFNEDWDAIEELKVKIREKEQEADETKITIRQQLTKSMFLPVPRGDLLRILNHQDDIADTAEDLCVLLTMRKTVVPSELQDQTRQLANKGLEACHMVLGATEELNLLMETSFTGPEAQRVLEKADQTGKLEYEADIIAQTALKQLFEMEDQLDPITIIFLMRLFNVLGRLANHAENCGDNLRHLVICRV